MKRTGAWKSKGRLRINLSMLACGAALTAALPALAKDVSINLTAARGMSFTPPNGQQAVPMWGYCTTPASGGCGNTWAPGPTIVAAPGDNLSITLSNGLPTPTSIVILGQVGGSVGQPTMQPSPVHQPSGLTWPAPAPASSDATFTPPKQPDRARAFTKEAQPGGSMTYTWTNLKPGTYLYETGSHPSLQAPMGLYGVLVVTQDPVLQGTTLTPGQAYPAPYAGRGANGSVAHDASAVLLLSEIDPAQNSAVDVAAQAKAREDLPANSPACGASSPCYPSAVNYNPKYFLLNGQAYDRTAPGIVAPPIAPASMSGNVLLRFANAGLRSHTPAVLGQNLYVVAEDGNLAPGNPKVQSEVLLTAGKTHDVLVKPKLASGGFAPGMLAVFDRQLSLSNDNIADGGMQGYIQIAGGALPAAALPKAVDDSYAVPPGSSTFGANVLANDVAIANPQIKTAPTKGTVTLNADGTFVYTPNGQGTSVQSDSFTYYGNGKPELSATVTLTVDAGKVGAAPVANPDSYASNAAFSAGLKVGGSGVLGNDTDPSGYRLTAQLVPNANQQGGLVVNLNPDGSFSAQAGAAGTYSFQYVAVNSQGTKSAPATVTLSFGQASGVKIALADASTKASVGGDTPDYRWVIEEDRTFHNSTQLTPNGADGIPNALATNFHASHMPVVATGCTGPISCGDSQTVKGAAVAPRPRTTPDSAALDPNKYYYLSVLPADAMTVDSGTPNSGHTMGGVPITPADIAAKGTLQVLLPPTPMKPAQLSIFVFEDNNPTNGAIDTAEINAGLGGFAVTINDTAGRIGDVAGQTVYDVYNMPLTNALFELDPTNCPRGPGAQNGPAGAENRVGVIYTCPEYDEVKDPQHRNRLPLAGHALVQNINPSRYDVLVAPGADRAQKGETWLQVSTLEGTRANDAFAKSGEPGYFQEFGPPGFHAFVGFVNPDRVNKLIDPSTRARDGGLCSAQGSCQSSVIGRVTNLHMSRPWQTELFDSNSNDVLSASTCYVGLNSQGGTGANIAIQACQPDGSFKFTGIPEGDYELVVWDEWLDQIIQYNAVHVAGPLTDMKNVPVMSWFTNIEQNAFIDSNGNGVQDDGEPGIAQIPMRVRYRDGSIGYTSPTDTSGSGAINELFPLFNWYVAESDTTRYKATKVNIVVDGGGPVDSTGPYKGILSSTYPAAPGQTPRSTIETFDGSVISMGIQGFISQTNIINWGKRQYLPGENGGITGMVLYAATRGLDDPRMHAQLNWEPGIPRVKVRLYRKTVAPDGSEGLVFVKETTSSSWDDKLPTDCPGQRPDDPFLAYTLGVANIGKCYDSMHNFNQTRPAVYDGRYTFDDIPAGRYVVEVIAPEGYEIVKEEDKNVLLGDAFEAPVAQQFAGVGNIFILPDQATVNAAARQEPGIAFPPCVGEPHLVPDFMSLYPDSGQVAPFAGTTRPLCNRKEIVLNDQMQATADFQLFTPTPIAAHYTGMILDDAASEFNAAAPDFGEKFAVPFVPIAMRDFNGNELGRVYADQWGMYNGLIASTWQANIPNPSGYAPNMVTNCMNDPGPIKDPATGKMVTDPNFNPMYSNFCYTNPFMPGSTTYLDTPVLPVAAFAAGYYPADCSYEDTTPAIRRVDDAAGNFGPYLPSTGGSLVITARGDVAVPNPAYAGPAETAAPYNQKTITRHYGFGSVAGKVMLGNVELEVTSWADDRIVATVKSGTPSGQLAITAANGKSTVDAVTVTVDDSQKNNRLIRVQASAGQTIQAAIDRANPGDLILVDEGSYGELVIMYKPVRLQGVGAASVVINAAKYPNQKLAAWRTRINDLFGIDAAGNQTRPAQVDPLPGQEITGGVVLLEPTVMSTEEGAGITVLAKNYPANHCRALNGDPSATTWQSNFLCGTSRIDGLSVTGGDSGGGVYVNGWAHNLEFSNNRVYGNAGTWTGGVRIGQPNLEALTDLPVPYGFNRNVRVHNNAITTNGTVESQLAASGGGGGLSLNSGTDNYAVTSNFICGNMSMADGGGVAHLGYSGGNNTISKNKIVFNQSLNQGSTNSGGGLAVEGEAPVPTGTTRGPGNLVVDANLIQGNHAASGHGGGVYLRDVANAGGRVSERNSVGVTNNMIVNNVAGWSGGGISLQNSAATTIINNTVARNDSTATVGAVFGNNPTTSTPQPAGISADRDSRTVLLRNNIVWENRAFFFSPVANSTGFQLNPVVSGCGGNSVNANYWDFGILGQPQASPALRLNPTSSLMTSVTDYTDNGNVSGDPLFASTYCNAARFISPAPPITPAPTVPFSMQAAGSLDEGGNWVDVRYGPLSLNDPAKPGQPNTVKPLLGDYHIAANSAALGKGAVQGAPAADYDGDARGAQIDIGADEYVSAPPQPVPLPALAALDNFNRRNATNLGSSWSQANLLGIASIQVNGNLATVPALTLPGYALWNVPATGYGANQGAAFRFVNAPIVGSALVLKASGGVTLGAPQHMLRVRVASAQAAGAQTSVTLTVETSDNYGVNFTPWSTTSPASFALNDVLSAVAYGDGTVRIYKTSGATATQIGAVQVAWPNATSGGRIGMYLSARQQVDDFAGGNVQ
ncbi:Ig-like domain-containing protein [Noviherbaspirillum pedocola]|uniref:Uncharacterized protein n=1 Tax=Noviherbaspirillum pedocola TaxID=2801341 RepID=A0A934SUT1_9BURK|nr:Ig-like domain-containing protein [Noviherbaspirillum pedocola]MBK4735830.1 hypothetical protein [Noviherbaspirillum pedocola]